MRRMRQRKTFLRCWEYFNCKERECPAYQSKDFRCWLQSRTHCHDEIKGFWIEKMEVCLKCEVFAENFEEKDSLGTLALVSNQFKDYKQKVSEETKQLEKARKKLTDFKLTSVYILRELDKKSKELTTAKSYVEKEVKKRTKELRDVQAQLVQSAKMASLGQFAAGVAHEINSPLGGILNFVRTLLGDPEIKGQRKGYLELILKGLLRIENIIAQILSFSGQHKIEPGLVNPNQLLGEALAFVKHRVEEEEIILRQDLVRHPPFIIGEPHRLQQVFMNIIGNALDALPRGGSLGIVTAARNKNVEIKFIDNGKGIKKEDLGRILDPFYTTKEVGKGVGLGLSISYTIIQQHKGTIDIESKNNTGTTVTVTLPIAGKE